MVRWSYGVLDQVMMFYDECVLETWGAEVRVCWRDDGLMSRCTDADADADLMVVS